MAARRPPPAPIVGRKPQTGLPPGKDKRQGPVVGARLSYLVWLQGAELVKLANLELMLRRKAFTSDAKDQAILALVPSPLTGPVRLRPGEDPLLRLGIEAIKQLDPNMTSAFDPSSPAVEVILEFLGSMRDLPPLGVIPAVQAGDLFAGWVNLDRVETIAEHPAIVHIEVLRTWTPATSPDSGNGRPRSGTPVDATATGRGVRIAVIDLGFDFLHPALVRQSGDREQVRTSWLIDMELPPPSWAPAGALGLRFTRQQLQEALDWYNSREGRPPGPPAVAMHLSRLASPPATDAQETKRLQLHGTAVAGIAAGNGRQSDPHLAPADPGVAPEADLALIAIGSHDETRFADSIKVLAAFQAAFADPDSPDIPTVALMANSDNLGPHDGSLDGERFLDELLLQPGRAIVLSAGNFNHAASAGGEGPAWHAFALPGSGNGTRLPLVLQYADGAAAPDTAEVWFRPPDGNAAEATISIKIRSTSIEPPVTVTESATPVTILNPEQNPIDGTTVVAQLQHDDEADACCLRLVFRPEQSRAIAKSDWTIDVSAEGPVHGWLDRNNGKIGRWVGPAAQAGAGLTTLGSPASATRPLSVGSVASEAGSPSSFSGCGPLRARRGGARKPDLVAVGENVTAPLGVPHARRDHLPHFGSAYTSFVDGGTSYAAPKVAGACALLFERFGPAATWADLRQAVLQATMRPPGMPAPEVDNWDPACGHGLLDVNALLSPPTPETPDLWLPKATGDGGTEPFVAETFWSSPALVLEDAAGRMLDPVLVATGAAIPARLRVRVANRGATSARDIVVAAWWAPMGAIHPLPHLGTGCGAWQVTGFGGGNDNQHLVAEVPPGEFAEAVFNWAPPRDANGGVLPHVLLAMASAEEDPYDPADTICSQNNVAALSVASVAVGHRAQFQIMGSEDTDGLILWCNDPHTPLRVEDMPVTALPWRDAAMFQAAKRRDRPLYGAPGASGDMAIGLSARLEGPAAVAEITDVVGADRLSLDRGRVTIEAHARLTLPRLRIAQGIPLAIKIAASDGAGGAIHLLHLSGGRRVGGSTALVMP